MIDQPRDYRLAPSVRVRLMGAALAGLGVLLVVATVVVAIAHASLDVLSAVIVLTVLVVIGLGVVLNRRVVLRLDPLGYRVRMVRGVGVATARWADVHDVQTAAVSGARCVVIRLRDGRTSTIPVDVVEGDSEQLVRDLTAILDRAQGTKRG